MILDIEVFNDQISYSCGEEKALLRSDKTVSWYSSSHNSNVQDARNLVAILQKLIQDAEAN